MTVELRICLGACGKIQCRVRLTRWSDWRLLELWCCRGLVCLGSLFKVRGLSRRDGARGTGKSREIDSVGFAAGLGLGMDDSVPAMPGTAFRAATRPPYMQVRATRILKF